MGKLLRLPNLLPLCHAHLWDYLGQQYQLIQPHRKALERAHKTLKTMLEKQKERGNWSVLTID